eukprot:g2132.t1
MRFSLLVASLGATFGQPPTIPPFTTPPGTVVPAVQNC